MFIVVTVVFLLMRLMPVEGYFGGRADSMTEENKQKILQNMGLLDPWQTVDKKGTFGFRKYPFTIISSFSSRQRSPFLSFHVASFFKFMDANKRVS